MASTDVATWIQAVGSAGSLIAFASWVGIAVLTRRDEFRQRFHNQARTVSAWVDKGHRHDLPDKYAICIGNGGEAPVYRCVARVHGTHDGSPDTVSTHLVPPHTVLALPAPDELAEISWDELYAGGVAPELTFTDSSGRHWRRDVDGIIAQERGPAGSTSDPSGKSVRSRIRAKRSSSSGRAPDGS